MLFFFSDCRKQAARENRNQSRRRGEQALNLLFQIAVFFVFFFQFACAVLEGHAKSKVFVPYNARVIHSVFTRALHQRKQQIELTIVSPRRNHRPPLHNTPKMTTGEEGLGLTFEPVDRGQGSSNSYKRNQLRKKRRRKNGLRKHFYLTKPLVVGSD